MQIGVIASHVNLAIAILSNAGCLEQHLVQSSVVALGQLLERLFSEGVFAPPVVGDKPLRPRSRRCATTGKLSGASDCIPISIGIGALPETVTTQTGARSNRVVKVGGADELCQDQNHGREH